MTNGMSEQELYEKAKKRVEEKKGFFIHLAIYIVVNAMLVLIWALGSGGGFPWFVFPLGGWGMGILFHYLGVFIFSGETGWERREIEKEMERLRKSRG
ncbi:MAG: 2TM domain-containing protein [Dehalococcoidales bacterium]|nr:2TM domain-containing protein [Dehalococcoidales bacterium]